jgi:hypothetical protein
LDSQEAIEDRVILMKCLIYHHDTKELHGDCRGYRLNINVGSKFSAERCPNRGTDIFDVNVAEKKPIGG